MFVGPGLTPVGPELTLVGPELTIVGPDRPVARYSSGGNGMRFFVAIGGTPALSA